MGNGRYFLHSETLVKGRDVQNSNLTSDGSYVILVRFLGAVIHGEYQ